MTKSFLVASYGLCAHFSSPRPPLPYNFSTKGKTLPSLLLHTTVVLKEMEGQSQSQAARSRPRRPRARAVLAVVACIPQSAGIRGVHGACPRHPAPHLLRPLSPRKEGEEGPHCLTATVSFLQSYTFIGLC